MERELKVAVALAQKAGRAIVSLSERGFRVFEKSCGGGPVTDADLAADAIIRRGLAETFPGDALTSEEGEDDPRRRDAGRAWLVDPLDGTKHFVDGEGEYAVMIGLAIDGVPALGVVHLPAERLTLAGARGHGVSIVTDGCESGDAVELPPWSHGAATAVRVASSRDAKGSRTRRAVDRIGPRELVYSGSIGRKVALILMGSADAYLTLAGRSHRWDSCAPEALVCAAGGHFSDAFGDPLDYRSADTRNDRGLLACRRGLERRFVESALGTLNRR